MVITLEKKEYLCRYHNIEEKIIKKKAYIAFCIEKAGSIPGPCYGEKINNPNPSTEAPFVKWIYRRIDAEAELKVLIDNAALVKAEIEATIARMINEEERRVLILHYIDWLPWSEIEDAMFQSKSSLMRLHRRALDNLVL